MARVVIGHHGESFKGGVSRAVTGLGRTDRESDFCEAAMVRHASPVKSPAVRAAVTVMLTVAILGAL